MSIIYLSGPMSGLPDYNYPAFHATAKRLRALGHTVLNPAEVDELHNPTPGTHQPWSWYMRHALRMIADAERVVVLDGWHKSRGALEEVRIAGMLDIPVDPPERVDPRFWDEVGK